MGAMSDSWMDPEDGPSRRKNQPIHKVIDEPDQVADAGIIVDPRW